MYVSDSLLRRHVIYSNAIEGIRARSGPLFTSHLRSARAVALETRFYQPLAPQYLHHLLTRSTPLSYAGGKMRTCRMWVGDHECPKHEMVSELMDWHEGITRLYVSVERSNVEELSWLIHNLFLSIHPYVDGNGRTARLLLNSLRLSRGLPWIVVDPHDRYSYYDRMKSTDGFLRAEFPSAF